MLKRNLILILAITLSIMLVSFSFGQSNQKKKTVRVLSELNDGVLGKQTKPKTSTRKKTKSKPIKRKVKTLFDEKESKKAKVVWKERSKVKSKK